MEERQRDKVVQVVVAASTSVVEVREEERARASEEVHGLQQGKRGKYTRDRVKQSKPGERRARA